MLYYANEFLSSYFSLYHTTLVALHVDTVLRFQLISQKAAEIITPPLRSGELRIELRYKTHEYAYFDF